MKFAQSWRLRRCETLHCDSRVRFASILTFVLSAGCAIVSAQTHTTQKTESDRHGLTCAQVLKFSSTNWVANYSRQHTEAEDPRAIAAYGKCYEARTDRLAASLARTGKGPLMGARGDFQDFDKALNDFASNALAALSPPAGAKTSGYAALYAKQFRYKFYRTYETRKFHAEPTPEDVEAVGLAKNHFGELLSALPDDKMHGVHATFGQIFERSPLAEEWRLEIYRYAIFLLEPSSATPFSPPPF